MLKLPTGWGARTQTLSVQGSTDGVSFTTIVASAGYIVRPAAQHGDHQLHRDHHPVRADQHHREHRLAGRAALRAGGLRHRRRSVGNLAPGKTMSESSHADVYVAGNANDGNQATYWESANNAFPQWLQVDLGRLGQRQQGRAEAADRLGHPQPRRSSVQGSTNGSTFTDIVASAGVHLRPGLGQHGDDQLQPRPPPGTSGCNITANTAWPAGQISEFEVYGPTTGDTRRRPRRPTWPTPSRHVGQITLTWNASTDRRQRRHRLRHLPQRHAADQRRVARTTDLHRHPAGHASR